MLVRKLGAGTLAWRGGSLAGGETGDVPLAIAERYAHKLAFLEDAPTPPIITAAVDLNVPDQPPAVKRAPPRKRAPSRKKRGG